MLLGGVSLNTSSGNTGIGSNNELPIHPCAAEVRFITIMIDLHPQYVNDARGARVAVVIPADEFQAVLEDLEDIWDLERAKAASTGTVPWEKVKADLATMP